ncbi:MAG: leucine-rich repeat domain-containing protein [Lachnospiraceae bacterium]|nr:leucine-rich repeat domain-containing protein [Lachnospiraceae bacterium]
MKKKSIITILLLSLVCLAFSMGCGSKETATSDDEEEIEETEVEISETESKVRDLPFFEPLTDEKFGEVTIDDNLYELHTFDKSSYTTLPIIDYAAVTVYNPDSIESEVEFEGNTYPVLYLSKLENTDVSEFEVPDSIWMVGHSCFLKLENLKSVKLNEGLGYIDTMAFCRCGIESVKIPASVKIITVTAFAENNSLEIVEFAEGSRLESINSTAFRLCPNLKEITIPASVTKIDRDVFEYDDSLEKVYFEDEENWHAWTKVNGEEDLIDLDVSDPEKNAESLREEYNEYIWYRGNELHL